MSNVKNRLGIILVAVIFIMFLLPAAAFASTLHLSPGGGTIAVGGTTSVQVRLNAGGDAVNGVSAYLSYPADKLEVAWVSGGGSFPIQAENSYGGGAVRISRGSFSGVGGNVTVATIGFRGKAAGSATVSFIGGSSAPRASDSSESLNLGGSSGAVFTVGGTAPAQTSKPASSDQKTLPKSAVAKLLISNIQTKSVSTNSAIITWQTNGEADSSVEYGLEKDNYFLNVSSQTLALNHSITLDSKLLTAGLKVHYKIRSKDTDGREVVSDNQILQLPGYQVKIKTIDEMGLPLKGVEVFLYSEPIKAVTDGSGEAVFENVSPGKHVAVIKAQGGEKAVELEVAAGDPSPLQNRNYAEIKIEKASLKSQTQAPYQIIAPAGGILVILIIAGVIIFIKKRKKNLNNQIDKPAPPL